jgi:acetyl-CoA synthetase
MSEDKVYEVPEDVKARSLMSESDYEAYCREAGEDGDSFWGAQARELVDWTRDFTRVSDVNYDVNDFRIRWFEGGRLNVCYNCVDRHAEKDSEAVALLWEGNSPDQEGSVTYGELKREVSKLGNALKSRGVKKGDRVTIYMPMIFEAAYAMLACARIGAVHTVVFGGFSPKALSERINDSESRVVITSDFGRRGTKEVPLKQNVDEALENCECVESVLVVKCTGGEVEMKAGRDEWYEEAVGAESDSCACEEMEAEDPLFILYTSGSTGKPKGVLHTTGGYLVYATFTHRYVFDACGGDDVYWCTADIGWVTGHSYVVYGPLSNGVKSLLFEGVPNYPDASRVWEVVDKHGVTILYTAPTAIRALMREGDDYVKRTSRKSLRVLGSVGEPINPEAWEWYYHVVGEGRARLVDTWWQTETGGIMISPLPGVTALKPGSACYPLPGIDVRILDGDAKEVKGEGYGALVIAGGWPGQARTLYGDHERFLDVYYRGFPGYYMAGDGVKRDADGYYWITGRMDDVINVSGHRMGTAEVESALVSHAFVSEAAVVGFPDDIKGQGIWAYVTLKAGAESSKELRKELKGWVRKEIGPIATPDVIQWSPSLPKTRSGKIMRRILRKVAEDDTGNLGDTSTLAEPHVVSHLVANRGEC